VLAPVAKQIRGRDPKFWDRLRGPTSACTSSWMCVAVMRPAEWPPSGKEQNPPDSASPIRVTRRTRCRPS